MLLLDTDVLIDVQRNHANAVAWFSGLKALPSVPGFVVMELIQDSGNNQQLRDALKLVKPFPIVWPTSMDCQKALADFTTFHLSQGLGLLDSLIGATAVGRAAELCTFNVKHYRVIPGLRTVQPYLR